MKKKTAAETEALSEFHEEFHFCWACGIHRDRAAWPGLQNNHIIRGSGRKNVRESFSMLCERCHRLSEGTRLKDEHGNIIPRLTLANLLWLKCAHDQKHFSPEVLQTLYFKVLPDPEPPDEWYFHRYRKNRGVPLGEVSSSLQSAEGPRHTDL